MWSLEILERLNKEAADPKERPLDPSIIPTLPPMPSKEKETSRA